MDPVFDFETGFDDLDLVPSDSEKLIQLENSCLVAKIASEKNISFTTLKNSINASWGLSSNVTNSKLEDNICLLKFGCQEDCDKAWNNRPWNVNGAHIVLQKWMQDRNVIELDLDSTIFWVQIHGLPPKYITMENAEKIARRLGEVEALDVPSEDDIRHNSFMRLRVKWSLNKPLITGFAMKRPSLPHEDPNKPLPPIWVSFKFEKLGEFCSKCGLFTHTKPLCKNTRVVDRSTLPEVRGGLGLWIYTLANRPFKAKKYSGNRADEKEEDFYTRATPKKYTHEEDISTRITPKKNILEEGQNISDFYPWNEAADTQKQNGPKRNLFQNNTNQTTNSDPEFIFGLNPKLPSSTVDLASSSSSTISNFSSKPSTNPQTKPQLNPTNPKPSNTNNTKQKRLPLSKKVPVSISQITPQKRKNTDVTLREDGELLEFEQLYHEDECKGIEYKEKISSDLVEIPLNIPIRMVGSPTSNHSLKKNQSLCFSCESTK